MRSITFENSREVDSIAIEQYGMSGLVLMENAGRGVAERLAKLYPAKRFLILCGKGNNGGDGFVIARHLQLLGCQPHVAALTSDLDSLPHDASVNARIAVQAELPMLFLDQAPDAAVDQAFADCDVIVDCLLGTGASGGLREPIRGLVVRANQANAHRIAVDVPTGWPRQDPEAVTLKADRTLTFVAAKVGMQSSRAMDCLGEIEIVGIGVPRKLLQQLGIE